MSDDDQRTSGVIRKGAEARHDRRGWRLQSVNRGPTVKSAHSYCTPDHLKGAYMRHSKHSNTENYVKFQSLVDQYADQIVATTRAERVNVKKKRLMTSTTRRTANSKD